MRTKTDRRSFLFGLSGLGTLTLPLGRVFALGPGQASDTGAPAELYWKGKLVYSSSPGIHGLEDPHALAELVRACDQVNR